MILSLSPVDVDDGLAVADFSVAPMAQNVLAPILTHHQIAAYCRY
jgi:hypothetical protein